MKNQNLRNLFIDLYKLAERFEDAPPDVNDLGDSVLLGYFLDLVDQIGEFGKRWEQDPDLKDLAFAIGGALADWKDRQAKASVKAKREALAEKHAEARQEQTAKWEASA